VAIKKIFISHISLIALIVLISLILPSQAFAQTSFAHPNMYLNQSEIDAIKAKVAANQEPWKTAYNKLISDANAALNMTPTSVVDDGGGHYWRTDDPYTTDGVYDPSAHRNDYINANHITDAMRDLALAYQLTGNTQYADGAILLINHWFINPATYMEPDPTNNGPATPGHGSGGSIEIYITLPAAFYAGDLLWDYPGWSVTDRSALQQWAQDALTLLPLTSYGNNWDNWLTLFRMSMAVATEDEAILATAFNRWKSLVGSQVRSDGLLGQELSRTRSLDYSMFSLNPMTQGAEIARHYGEDLYSYTTADGKNLEKVFNAYTPYLLNPSSWPYQQIIVPFTDADGVQVYEMGYLYKQKPEYLQVVNLYRSKHGGVLIDNWTQGPLTLTHAYGAYPFQILNPTFVSTPVISPPSTSFLDTITVSITDPTAGASIYYTVGGTNPDQSSLLYTGPIIITESTTVKARAYAPGLDPSTVASATYTKVVGGILATASTYQNDGTGYYGPDNTLDGNYATRWSAQGDGQWIQYELAQPTVIQRVLIAWYNGNLRTATFDLLTSPDAVNWTTHLLNQQSSGTTTILETYDIPDTTARYVRIVGHGNSANDWNSIAEVAIEGTGGSVTPPPTTLTPTPTNTPLPTATPTPGSSIILPDPYAFYSFDEGTGSGIIDMSGHGLHGLLNNVSWVESKESSYGTALWFSGILPDQEYASISSFELPASTSELTITAWIYPTAFTGTSRDNRIITKSIGTAEQDHEFMLSGIVSGSNTRLRFRLKTGNDPSSGTTTLIALSGNLTLNTWHHVAGVYDGSNMILYKDGIEVGRVAKTGNITTTSAPTLIGLNPLAGDPITGGGYGGWQGMIDDVRIYTESLTSSEIQAVMISPNQNQQPSTPGDTDGDGDVDIEDIIILINEIFTPSGVQGSDINSDGKVDILDVIALINIIFL